MFVGTPTIEHHNTFPDHHPSAFLILDMNSNLMHLPGQIHHSRQQNIPLRGGRDWSGALIHKLGTNTGMMELTQAPDETDILSDSENRSLPSKRLIAPASQSSHTYSLQNFPTAARLTL